MSEIKENPYIPKDYRKRIEKICALKKAISEPNTKSGQEMQQKGLQDILIEMRDKTEESIKKAHFIGNNEKKLELLHTYRTLTKIIEGKPLNIFDFYIVGKLKGVTNECISKY